MIAPWLKGPGEHFHSSLSWSARRGSLPEKGQFEWWSTDSELLTIGWAGYAEYRVGLRPAPFAETTLGRISESEAALAFLLSVLPICLPLFDIEPLHGSAVQDKGGALLLLGPSGAGKSSLAAAMEMLGFGLLADDCCAVDEEMRLWPGPPMLNPRWNDAEQPIVGTYNAKNLRVPQRYSTHPQQVAAVISLEPAEGAELYVEALHPREALVRILANARSPGVFASRRRNLQFHVATALSALSAVVLTYDPTIHRFDEVAENLAEWIG